MSVINKTMADPREHNNYHVFSGLTEEKKAEYRQAFEDHLKVDPEWSDVTEDEEKIILGRYLKRLEAVEYDDISLSDIFTAASYYSGDCTSYDCSSSPCGCTAPDCTSPNTTDGTQYHAQIDSSADDGQWVCGSACTDIDCDMGDYNPMVFWKGDKSIFRTQAVAGGPINSWYKFKNVTIPDGAKINKALVTFKSQTTTTGTGNDVVVDITMVCEDDYTIDCFPASGETDPADLPRLATSINWNINYNWTTDVNYSTPDLGCLVQERVDSTSWASGGDMTFLVITDGTATDSNATRSPYDYANDSTKAATLDIWWSLNANEEGSGGVVADGTALDSFVFNIVGTGGVVAGGSALIEGATYTEEGSGGVICDGTASYFLSFNEDGTGGVVCGGEAVDWTNDFLGFLYRVKVTVPAGAVSEDLEKFYLGINATLDTSHVFYGDDFKVTDEAGSRLYHELRSYDADTGQVHVFFKADLLADSDNVFWLYYGGVTE